MKKFQTRSAMLVAVIILIASAAMLLLKKKPVAVEWRVLSSGEALETVLANGRVAGSRITPLALLSSGIVSTIPVSEGMTVAEGDTLLILDNREEHNRVRQRTTELSIARINLEKLQGAELREAQETFRQARLIEEAQTRLYGRSDTLYKQGAITREAFDEIAKTLAIRNSERVVAETRLESLKTGERALRESQVEKARLLLDEAQIALSRTVLRAPSDGKVIEIALEPGAYAAAGARLVLFLPSDSMAVIEAQVDELDAGRIHVGQRAVVGIYGDDTVQYEAVVRGVTGRIDTERGTATVRIGITSGNVLLIADQTVSVQIITGSQSAARVVEQRFRFTADGSTFVYVKQGGRVVRKQVVCTDIGNGRSILDEGVADGDTVVFAPGLGDNVPVTLLRSR
ncbi:MAG: HlyD family efflux transporter periplasmic adaptor subunit [Chitinispirillaceae bacterium]|nr:HlyD family efflux transporter periplasmic adaptor subunit [Chitinispirillaceae bacterium]